jgi:hypothetical protein
MTQSEAPSPEAPDVAVADPELEALPEPRRPGRNLTLVVMALTGLASVVLALSLRHEALYALQRGQPTDLGELGQIELGQARAGSWIRGAAELGTNGAIRYSRPLDRDTYRLAPVVGNERLWVEIRVPAGFEGPYFVPPTSFVGRLVPVSRLGLRHLALPGEVRSAGGASLSPDAWLVVDGESPASLRWALGLVVLLAGFAVFNAFGLYRLLRPVRDA